MQVLEARPTYLLIMVGYNIPQDSILTIEALRYQYSEPYVRWRSIPRTTASALLTSGSRHLGQNRRELGFRGLKVWGLGLDFGGQLTRVWVRMKV